MQGPQADGLAVWHLFCLSQYKEAHARERETAGPTNVAPCFRTELRIEPDGKIVLQKTNSDELQVQKQLSTAIAK
jgi:hypothetical protein